MGSLGERIIEIQELAKKSQDKHKVDELQVAVRFIEYHNNTNRTDYVLSKKQPLSPDDPVDVLINWKSDSGKILKVQVKTFNPKFRAAINKSAAGEFLRVVSQSGENPFIKEFKIIIQELKIKYKDTGSELIILFDGFWGFDLKEKLTRDLGSFFTDKMFKEAWVVYSGKNCKRLL